MRTSGRATQSRNSCHGAFVPPRIVKIERRSIFYFQSSLPGQAVGALGWLPPKISLSESLSCLPALNFAERLAVIWIDSPVFGLRPVRACRVETENVPKPEMFTRSPCLSALMTSSSTMLTALSASPLFSPSLLAKPSIKSALVMSSLPRTGHLAGVNIKIGRPPTSAGRPLRAARPDVVQLNLQLNFPHQPQERLGLGVGETVASSSSPSVSSGFSSPSTEKTGARSLGLKNESGSVSTSA